MPQSLDQRCCELLGELGIAEPGANCEVRPLTGGVGSDIAVVSTADRDVVVKFALGKLKVTEDWFAPIHRNKAEYAWLAFAHDICPQNAPKIFGRSEDLQGFAMEFLRGQKVSLWKDRLLSGAAPEGEAEKVGELLGRIHAASTSVDFDDTPFQNQDDFHALRLEPYLSFTARKHPDLEASLEALAETHYAASQVLVHGDVSPKNILLRDGAPVLLDAECATMGDPSFDLAFCLNHLVLKAIHLPRRESAYLTEALKLWVAYAPYVGWEDPADLDARVTALLPALMLARVDGKSPVEYLTQAERDAVRALARPLISEPVPKLAVFLDILRQRERLI